MLLKLVGRLVSVKIDICKKNNGEGVCDFFFFGGGGGGMEGREGGRWEGMEGEKEGL